MVSLPGHGDASREDLVCLFGKKEIGMRVVFLTSESVHHSYYINRIAEEHEVVRIFYQLRGTLTRPVVGTPEENEKAKSIRMADFQKADEYQIEKYGQEGVSCKVDETKFPVQRINLCNDESTVKAVDDLAPDVVLVYGTEVLKQPIIDTARKGIFNIHRGILPQYRGCDSDLWAMLNGEFNMIGVTTHHLVAALDAGDITFQERVKLDRDDDTWTMLYKTNVLGTEMILETLRRLEKDNLKATPQGKGKCYRLMPDVTYLEAKQKLLDHVKEL